MNHFTAGEQAETAAAAFLTLKGCQIIARNWRTRWCEIDIVARRLSVVYLCEVKYRANAAQGTGLEYITARKLRQMRFAAALWVAEHDWPGTYELCAIEVTGPAFQVTAAVKVSDI